MFKFLSNVNNFLCLCLEIKVKIVAERDRVLVETVFKVLDIDENGR